MRYLVRLLAVCGFSIALISLAAATTFLSREPDDNSLRLGQRVYVDDGTCPGGQVKEVTGSKLDAAGLIRTRQCVPRKSAKN